SARREGHWERDYDIAARYIKESRRSEPPLNGGGSTATMWSMGLLHVSVSLRVPSTSAGAYDALFLVDTGATDSMAPGSDLLKVGIHPIGRTTYELADGSAHEYDFGLAQIDFMGEVTAGRVVFGPNDVEPILGVTALES